MGWFNWVPKPVKRTVKVAQNPLKTVRDVTGYTEMKQEAMRRQREQEASVAEAQKKQESALAAENTKERKLRVEEARRVSSRRSAGAGGFRGYRSLLSPSRVGGSSSKLSGMSS